MWVFTRIGFFSGVCCRKGDGKINQPVDHDRIMVRARLKEHLENLRAFAARVLRAGPECWTGDSPSDARKEARHLQAIVEAKIHVSTSTDYRCRIFIPKVSWSLVLRYLALDEDYDNFKSAVAKREGHSSPYEHALHGVWSQMYRLQEQAHGPGIYSKPSKKVDPVFDEGDLPTGFDFDALGDEEPVLKVESRKGTVVCYIVRPRDFGTDEQAFATVIESHPEKHCKNPKFHTVSWGDVKGERGKKGVLIY